LHGEVQETFVDKLKRITEPKITAIINTFSMIREEKGYQIIVDGTRRLK